MNVQLNDEVEIEYNGKRHLATVIAISYYGPNRKYCCCLKPFVNATNFRSVRYVSRGSGVTKENQYCVAKWLKIDYIKDNFSRGEYSLEELLNGLKNELECHIK